MIAKFQNYIFSSFTIDNLPGEYFSRVFIGGNYRYIALLREIGKFVWSTKVKGRQSRFIPLLAYNCPPPTREDTRAYAIKILKQCKFAIFEVSIPTEGVGIELEQARVISRRNKQNVLLTYQIGKEGIEPHFSDMLLELSRLPRVEIFAYGYLNDLKREIKDWLRR